MDANDETAKVFEEERDDGSKKYMEMMESHPILYGNRHLPMTETCMCWGIGCGKGWYYPLRNLSDKLEMINITSGRMFGFAIKAEQVKEKYGTLRFYYRISPRDSVIRYLPAPFELLSECLFNAGTRLEKNSVGKRFLPVIAVARNALSKIAFRCRKFSGFVQNALFLCKIKKSEWDIMVSGIDGIVRNLVDATEKECFSVCEDCGATIGTEWSSRCETQGWIRYVCEDCAKKLGGVYAVYGDKSEDTKYFLDGKDITEEHKAQIKKYNEELREYHNRLKEKEENANE